MNAMVEGLLLGLLLFTYIIVIRYFFKFWSSICNGIFSFCEWVLKKVMSLFKK